MSSLRIKRKGMSIAESGAVLAVASVVAATAVTSAVRLTETSKTVDYVAEIETDIRKVFFAVDFSNISIDTLVSSGVLTASQRIDSERAMISGQEMTVAAFSTERGMRVKDGFSLSFENMSKDNCIYYATRRANTAHNVVGVLVNNTDASSIKHADARKLCRDNDTNTAVFSFKYDMMQAGYR